jgi:peptide/nickel transport system permease protein
MSGELVTAKDKYELFQKQYHVAPMKDQLSEIKEKYLKFLFMPGVKDDEFVKRDFLLNRLKSKRKFASKLNNTLTKLGIFIVFIILTWAVFAPWLTPYNYFMVTGIDFNIDAFAPPSPAHPLGVTKFGRDVLGRLIWAARSSLTIGLLSIIISCVFGVMLGTFSAYTGGWVDNLIMRIVDIIMAFPGLIMVIIIISILGPQMHNIMLVYGVLGIVGYARVMRGAALQEKTKTYVEAARVSGASNFKIMFKHILPNCIAPIIVSFTFDIGGIILSLAGLSFLGFGDTRLVEWGTDINDSRSKIYSAPWAAVWPGFGILFTVLGFMLLGDGLRDALDPRLQSKRKK